LADDTISIFEPSQKNSGVMEGKFLERNKYKNIDKNGLHLTPTDINIGGDVKINGYSFHVLSCDEYT
jgi:EF-hand domain-containing protein 1